jgi:ABC-2 type transport system ATP-binding protein
MSTLAIGTRVLEGRGVRKTYRRPTGEAVVALDDVSFDVDRGKLTALVGPDGAGKTTLIRLTAGLISANAGRLNVLGIDVSASPEEVQQHLGYMPQRFGLYEDLTVRENLDLYADMHGITDEMRQERYPRLLEMTALGPFTGRLAGRLSGGMKQKLGLACTLVRSPELLILDEPTVGVDPLSRKDLWEIILQLVRDEGLTVLVSTSYLNEAQWCDRSIVLREGKLLAQGSPSEVSHLADGRVFLAEPPAGTSARQLQARLLDDPAIIDAVPEGGYVRLVRADETRWPGPGAGLPEDLSIEPTEAQFEDGFMILLRATLDAARRGSGAMTIERPTSSTQGEVVVSVRDLVRRFGAFTAVDHVSFEVRSGEIFGLLGPNGAGKTTTFRMLCGLLPSTGGVLRVAGVDVREARAGARERIGYVAQKFSLYGQLSVMENLEFFASAYGLYGRRRRGQIDWALRQFELERLIRLPSGQLPGGYRQRLAMAVALLHQPEILFLDEPTSGADPVARREFWRRITSLAEQGVTVIVTTHFMVEAEYCDRVAIMDAGRVLAQGTPAEVRVRAQAGPGHRPTMEDAFIAIVEAARQGGQEHAPPAGGGP